jgi:hypothetical protein
MVQTFVNRAGIRRVSCEDDNSDGVMRSAWHRHQNTNTEKRENWTPARRGGISPQRARRASKQEKLEGREGNVASRRSQDRR